MRIDGLQRRIFHLLAIFLLGFLMPVSGSAYLSDYTAVLSKFFSGSAGQQPGEKDIRYKVHILRGDSLLNLKDYQRAMVEFQRASALMPFEEYPRLQMQRIDAIVGVKRLEEERAQAEAAVEQEEKSSAISDRDRRAQVPQTTTQEARDSTRAIILGRYESKLKSMEQDKNMQGKAQVLSEMAGEFREAGDHASALNYFRELLVIEEKHGTLERAANVLENMAEVYIDSGAFNNSVVALEKSLTIKQEGGDLSGAVQTLKKIGNIHEGTYNYQEALNSYIRAAEVTMQSNDKQGFSVAMDNIGNVYYKQQILDKSIDSYKQSAEINEKLNNPEALGSTLNKMGVALFELGRVEEAEQYYQRSFDLKQRTGNQKEASMALNNLGNISLNQNKYRKAITFYERSLQLKEGSNYLYGKAVSSYNLGLAYKQIDAISQAVRYFESCLALSQQQGFDELFARCLKELIQIYSQQGKTDKVTEYDMLLQGSLYKDVPLGTLLSESEILGEADESQKLITFLTEEVLKQKEIAEQEARDRARDNQLNSQQLRLKNEQIKRQRIVLVSMVAVIFLVICLLSLFYYQIVQKKRANRALTAKNALISKQAKLIYDNIKSASAIQRAAMPPDSMLNSELPQHFVLNMPKDIVSGDFYWMEKRDGNLFVAVADCTGHGVQGAVVSMLGMALLNEIVNKSYDAHPGEILNQLSFKLKESLHASGDIAEIREGMDIVLCKFNKSLTSVEFAGANNPLYLIRNKEVTEFKGDRSPIGYYSKEVNFTNQIIELQKGDTLYLFSDGYYDQLSGESYKKFLPKRFKEHLIEIDDMPMNDRHDSLVSSFNNWKGTFQQVDDVLVMCIKV